MRCRANSGYRGEAGPEFICYVKRRHPQIHEFWTFGEDGVTHEVHPTARLDVGVEFFGEFDTDNLTTNWRRVPMF